MLKRIITCLPTQTFGRVLGRLLHLCAVSQRRIVRRNLQFAFPEFSPHQVRQTARRVFQNYGITLVEVLQMGFFSRDDILRRVKLHGIEQALENVGLHKGVVVVSAHLGNWEIGMQVLPCFFNQPLTAVAKKFKSGWIENWLHRVRTRFGSQILYKKGVLAEMTRIGTRRRGAHDPGRHGPAQGRGRHRIFRKKSHGHPGGRHAGPARAAVR